MEQCLVPNTEELDKKVKQMALNEIDINSRRKEYLSWEDYFMATAFLAAQRSKDPSSQVGACIVNSEKKIVGIGYNGMPTGCSDEELPWSRVGDSYIDTKYAFGMSSIILNFKLNLNIKIYYIKKLSTFWSCKITLNTLNRGEESNLRPTSLRVVSLLPLS